MIQVNLIPDLKAEYLRAQRNMRIVSLFALIIIGVCGFIVFSLYSYVNFAQKQHGENLSRDVTSLTNQYYSVEDLDKIITVQNQLKVLPKLHEDKPLVWRTASFLSAVTPGTVSLESVDVSIVDAKITFVGTADTVAQVNRFVNGLKNASYYLDGEEEEAAGRPFSGVLLDSVEVEESIDGQEGETKSTFSVTTTFDTAIYLTREDVVILVPELDSTLSEVESPSSNPDRSVFEDTSEEGQ